MNPKTDTPESAEAMKPKKGYAYQINEDLRKIAQAHPETTRTIEKAISHISADWPPCLVELGEIGIVHAHVADLKHAQQSDTALKLQRCEDALGTLLTESYDFQEHMVDQGWVKADDDSEGVANLKTAIDAARNGGAT